MDSFIQYLWRTNLVWFYKLPSLEGLKYYWRGGFQTRIRDYKGN